MGEIQEASRKLFISFSGASARVSVFFSSFIGVLTVMYYAQANYPREARLKNPTGMCAGGGSVTGNLTAMVGKGNIQ